MRAELGAVAVAGVVMGAAMLGGTGDALADPVQAHGVAPGAFVLEVGNVHAGWIHSVEGGHATSEVVSEKIGPDHIAHKHLAGVKYEDITVVCGTGMSKAFYQWLQNSFEQKHVRKDGSIHTVSPDYKVERTIDFTNGLITEVGIPALDASSKDSSKLSVKFAPEHTRFTPKLNGGKSIDPARHALGKGEQKVWLPSNFRFDYTGCGDPCKQANKLSAVTVKVGAPPAKGAPETPLHLTNIVVTMPPPQDATKWATEGSGRNGTLEYRTVDGSVFVAFVLIGLRPVRMTVLPGNNKPMVELELSVQSAATKPSG